MSFPFQRIRHLLIDLDGVLYRGNTPIDGSREFVKWLHERNISFRLVTNNATLTPAQYVAKLASMNIAVSEDEIFTSSLATSLYLQNQNATGQSVFVIGEDGLLDAVLRIDMKVVDDGAEWVVVGLDRSLTYAKLARGALLIQRGARFIGSNPDRSFPSEAGLVPGAGAILAALEATTGVEPIVIGKPKPLMLTLAIRSLGGSVHDTAMIGDRLDTDIAGAKAVGIPSILVLTGVSSREDAAESPVHPELIVENLSDLMHLWRLHIDGE